MLGREKVWGYKYTGGWDWEVMRTSTCQWLRGRWKFASLGGPGFKSRQGGFNTNLVIITN
ncbi:hypothetical protein Hanom_Chr11g00993071 [Helianthus anomalus]